MGQHLILIKEDNTWCREWEDRYGCWHLKNSLDFLGEAKHRNVRDAFSPGDELEYEFRPIDIDVARANLNSGMVEEGEIEYMSFMLDLLEKDEGIYLYVSY